MCGFGDSLGGNDGFKVGDLGGFCLCKVLLESVLRRCLVGGGVMLFRTGLGFFIAVFMWAYVMS